jgi:hypothetical protein
LASGAVDCAIDSSATQQCGISSVNNRVNVLAGDVSDNYNHTSAQECLFLFSVHSWLRNFLTLESDPGLEV